MNESNIDWILAIACFLAGIGIGALGYHLLNANVARNQKVRQRLAETELELNQVRDALNDHFAKATDLVANIQRQSQELEQQLNQSADRLCDDLQLKRRLNGNASDEPPMESEEPSMPRDYADGGRGTLAEDFGLRQDETKEKEQTQPVRY
ncbi:YhcB family protein [Halomonas sp. McH1-25]|uniref:YhcB family protein n=1 Tax=unclassified Halomonas TaxID=2609666 RepID=UPI001EF6554E|nr:YhcB family protein [Halomonas sp. McH1-25]MCP1342417.1 YhcB family protein [Halomonas sp. FL8]MCP1362150.1 YhcB family protein [Halomonas sp. BBD45]MCP1365369.1 YhcB family protein [Halomonas sp. BBD48]